MAGGQEREIEGYKFKVRPKRKWRGIFLECWPYWQGSKPSFTIIMTGENEDMPERKVEVFTVFPDSHTVNVKYDIPRLKKGQRVELYLAGSFQALTGDTKIVVESGLNVSLEGISPEHYHTLYSFHVTPKTWVSLAVIAGIVAGLFTSIFQSWID